MNLFMNHIEIVEAAIQAGRSCSSKLPRAILEMEGMSGLKYRHMLNKLMELAGKGDPVNYLEIGSRKGSTFCSSVYGNNINALSIDNFSEFVTTRLGGNSTFSTSSEQFKHNITQTAYWSPRANTNISVLNQDSFTVDPTKLPFKADIYFYDGEHSYASQYKAFTHFDAALKDTFITMVDDYTPIESNDPCRATQTAFKDLGYKVLKDWYLKEGNSDILEDAKKHWWNGVYVAVCQKTERE